jgi:hypothetical protein
MTREPLRITGLLMLLVLLLTHQTSAAESKTLVHGHAKRLFTVFSR